MSAYNEIYEYMQDKIAYRVFSSVLNINEVTCLYKHTFSNCVEKGYIMLCDSPEDTFRCNLNVSLLLCSLAYLKQVKTIYHVPFVELKADDKVISATGTPGVIREILYTEDGDRLGNIIIDWQNGNVSNQPYLDCGMPTLANVEYVGR